MKLLRATFLSIRGVADATHDFGDPALGAPHDVVVVTGPPASGKTRLLEAILAAKEVIAPYGPMMTGARWITPGAPTAKIELAFHLDESEQKRAGASGPVVAAEALFAPERCRGEADEGLVALLEHYAHDPQRGKVEYLADNRGLPPPGAMHGLGVTEQRLLRVTRDPRKYSFVPRLLFALTWEGAYAPARARFQSALGALSPTVRYLGPSQDDPTLCFASRGGPRVTVADLASSEVQAVIVAAVATLLHLERSIVLVDRPEISADERSITAWLHGVRGLAADMQLIVATGSPALLGAVDPRTVITLGVKMATYYVDEASFELPDLEVQDRTVNVLELGGGAVPGLGLMIARTPFPTGKSLRNLVKAHLDHERRTLRSWSLLFERDGEVEGRPMIELGTRWKGDLGLVYQRQAHIGLDFVVLLLVGNGPLEERERTDAHVERALSTLQLRAGG